jgi:hypothetical protein
MLNKLNVKAVRIPLATLHPKYLLDDLIQILSIFAGYLQHRT